MYGYRSFSGLAVRAALLIAPLPLCAGCWEKIEYTGARTPAATSPAAGPAAVPAATPATPSAPASSAPVAAVDAAATQGTTSDIFESPASAPSVATTPAVAKAPAESQPKDVAVDAPALPPTVTSTPSPPASPPKVEDDRYATPPASSAAPALADPIAAEPQTPAPAAATTAAPQATTQPVAPAMPPDPTDRYATAAPTSAPATPATTPAVEPPRAPAAAPKSIDSRQAAWFLGSQLSLAALAHDRGAAADKVPIWYENARAAAKLLGVSVADLPEPAHAADKGAASERLIAYLINSYKTIGPQLQKQHGTEQIALFDVALQSNMLLLLYTPDGSEAKAIAMPMAQTAPHMKVPSELWQPLLDLIDQKAPTADVQKAIQKMHADIERYLAENAGQGGR